MAARTRTIAVTGLNATDNPAPGVAVLRCLRDACPHDRLVGLAYDALDPGAYALGLIDDVFMLPYPSSDPDAFFERLCQIHAELPLSVIIPTLDAELPVFIGLAQRLEQLGIAALLPTREQFDARSKANLTKLARRAGFQTPDTLLASSIKELHAAQQQLRFPMYVKSPFYGAELATNSEEAAKAFQTFAAEWGYPIVLQACVPGPSREERNVVALGDGRGGLAGAVTMKKLAVTDKGKGWAGVTIRDDKLMQVTRRFVATTEWRGPFELESMLAGDGTYYVIEINPRFPAWAYLSASAGVNLPERVLSLATGTELAPAQEYKTGMMFVRISLDQIAHVADLERLVVMGQWRRGPA